MKLLEMLFEGALWRSRYVVLFAVLAAMACGFAILYVTTTDVVLLIGHVAHYADPSLEQAARKTMHDETVTHIVSVVDGYLLATFMLIFSLGLYELFISDIDEARSQKAASRILVIETLDDLKQRLAKLIIMILIVTLFERTLTLKIENPLDVVYIAVAIALIGVALFFTHKAEGRGAGEEEPGEH
jgi:uncharacterized membrane protein YqhA